MYASHNSLTFAKPRKWWQWFFQPFSKCQKVDILSQIEEGVRFFDIHVRLYNGDIIPAHGLVEYKIKTFIAINRIEANHCYYRVILEDAIGYKGDAEHDLRILKNIFLSKDFPHCIYVARKSEWIKYANPWIKYANPYCDWQPTAEIARHHWTYCKPFIPRFHVGKYKPNKYAESLNLEVDKGKIFYYDFVNII